MYTKSPKYPNLGVFDDNYDHLPPPDDIDVILNLLEAAKGNMKIKKEADVSDDEVEEPGTMRLLFFFVLIDAISYRIDTRTRRDL